MHHEQLKDSPSSYADDDTAPCGYCGEIYEVPELIFSTRLLKAACQSCFDKLPGDDPLKSLITYVRAMGH